MCTVGGRARGTVVTGPTEAVTTRTSVERITAECNVCGMSVNAPNKGLGRALVATFKTQHQHNRKDR